jgi:hypothetical protein
MLLILRCAVFYVEAEQVAARHAAMIYGLSTGLSQDLKKFCGGKNVTHGLKIAREELFYLPYHYHTITHQPIRP